MHRTLFSLLLVSTLGFSETIVPATHSDLHITIYNDNKAFINDTRQVMVREGKQKLIYEGIPSSVITQSVVPTFTGVQTYLYSQNYIYDLISLTSMLKNSINKTVDFYTNGENPRLTHGTLLSVNPVMIQENATGSIYTLNSPTQVIFSKIPETMITKPSLVWSIETAAAGTLDIDLKYLANGISWKSDYVLNLNKDTLDLRGWITVNNHSGVAYKDAKITCLAGEVNRARENAMVEYDAPTVMYKHRAEALPVKEEAFSGYHIYKIPFRETIENKQQKQISFIDKKEIHYQQYGVANNHYFEKYTEQKMTFANTIELQNTKANHLGISLPSGVVRMYQKDSSKETHFIGEQNIANIPEDENVTLTIGTLFDVVGEKTITKFISKNRYRDVETTYTLRNQGKESIVLKIKEQIPTYGNHISVKTSCRGICSVEKKSAFIREFTVKLRAKEKYQFTSEFEVNY